jgi:branched-chain amino acid aminotransferase
MITNNSSSRPLLELSYQSNDGKDTSTPSDIDPSKLDIIKCTKPKELQPPDQLVFGKTFTGELRDVSIVKKSQLLLMKIIPFPTDHMLTIKWTISEGWSTPCISPYQNLSMDPASCVFHYAFECFEGMKAYKDKHGKIRLFRPHKNMARLNLSSKRVALPTFDEEALLQLIVEFVKLESRFIYK